MYLHIIDFGLVVLIWVVQLVIYPSFHFVDKSGFRKWHNLYSNRISFVVMPLMLSQLVIHAFWLFSDFQYTRMFISAAVLAVWLITFLLAVPIHEKISQSPNPSASIARLIKINWWRTIIWSIIFLAGIITQERSW